MRDIYYAKNRDKILKYNTEYNIKYVNDNLDNVRKYQRLYRLNNKESINKTKSKYAAKRAEEPLYKIKKNIRELIRLYVKSKLGRDRGIRTEGILGCDYNYLFKHLCDSFEYNYGIGRQYIIWKDVHIDHIIPISSAVTESCVVRLNHYSNLQLLFAEDNIEKSNKLDYVIP